MDEREARLNRYYDNPMPRELGQRIGDYIEPQTINAGLKHEEVMICIRVAYPELVDYFRNHPEALADTPKKD
jgi:hypothetical protein